MTCGVEFVRSAAKTYSRLDPVLQRRVDRELNQLSETPHHSGVIRLQSHDDAGDAVEPLPLLRSDRRQELDWLRRR